MPIAIGTQLGSHEITALLGKGGMGEVYRARDLKLKREVAIKILPEGLSRDADRVSRFQREAEVLASLNHPNIAAIHDLEEINGTRYLVLELVEGETLADRIERGPIPLEETLDIAKQIAEALEAAHERGIIHRDLKPANVKLTPEGKVKVLDFGLAKAMEGAPTNAMASNSPTLLSATIGGVLIGTAAYMAPEQARGKKVDQRADIWAFGVLFMEMLTARRAFEGETVADTLAKVLERDPDWHDLPRRTPDAVRSLLRHCLTKNVKDRLQAMGDARMVIQELLANPGGLTSPIETAGYPLWKKVLPWSVSAVLLALATYMMFRPLPGLQPQTPSRFEYELPGGQNLVHGFRHGLDLSSDGTRLAFVANTLGGADAASRIYVRNIDQWDAVAVPGTEGGQNPFLSPDGKWLGFLQQGQMKKVELGGGRPVVLNEKAIQSFGLTWGTNRTIVFAPATGGVLKVIPETGGEPHDFTTLNAANDEYSHRLPHFLPGAKGVLFTVLRFTGTAPDWNRAQIWVTSPKTGGRKLLIENGVDARYASNGHLVFARQGKLFAVGFDLKNLAVTGQPVPVLDGITHAEYGGAGFQVTGAAQFSLSDNGSIFYAPGSIEPEYQFQLVWVDRTGKVVPVATKPLALFNFVRISPVGRRIIFSEYYVNKDLWMFDPATETLDRQTTQGQNFNPVFSPDGSRIAFRSDRTGPNAIYMKDLGNSNDIQLTSGGPYDNTGSWTPDGKAVAFMRRDPQTSQDDIYIVSVDQPNNVRPILKDQFNKQSPEFSPDGHWLAYCSNKSGRYELYVMPYPEGQPVPVSTDGGREPAWSRDGKELFYRSGQYGQNMMSVRFKAEGAKFLPEKPVMLFDGEFAGSIPRSYDVASDGRFLMIRPTPDPDNKWNKTVYPSKLRLVLNWTDELQRLMSR
jgi:serine/threonine-protein kinase